MWQYRPWAADWALSVPYQVYETLGPGRYEVDLATTYEPGEMWVGEFTHRGSRSDTIVLNAHTCHPRQVNDDLAGVVLLVRLFQWLKTQRTRYSYRLILAPEHLGTVFYLRDRTRNEIDQMVSGIFAEMPGTQGPLKVASSFLGNQWIDRAFRNAVRHHSRAHEFVPWRQGAGNDETVWEAPGYEVPFVEVSRCLDLKAPYREYHTSLDTPEIMDEARLAEFYEVLQGVIETLEENSTLHRKFDGLICLSNPEYDLYLERPDPAIQKNLADDSEKWGHLLDCLFRYFDGKTTLLDIAERHDLPFDRLHRYLSRFVEKGLVDMEFAPVGRHPVSSWKGPAALWKGPAALPSPVYMESLSWRHES
jgi:aminopeptidase-like protein